MTGSGRVISATLIDSYHTNRIFTRFINEQEPLPAEDASYYKQLMAYTTRPEIFSTADGWCAQQELIEMGEDGFNAIFMIGF